MANYVDPATIDSIQKARRDPASLVKKPQSGKQLTSDQEQQRNLDANKKRIAKMKEMYSLFLKMEKDQEAGTEEAQEEIK